MQDDALFRLLLTILIVVVGVVRVYYQRQARHAGPSKQFESTANIATRSAGGLVAIAALVLRVAKPEWLAWSSMPLWPVLRWTGVVVGFAATLLLVWAHRTLGKNFTGTLHLRAEHTLVTSGPYHWIRHPMYTALLSIALAFFLLSANWFIGAMFIGGLTAVIATRMPKEEQVMASRFGSDCQSYAARTGRLLPRLRT